MINVTKTYLPDRSVINKHLDDLYSSKWVTNNGPKLTELEKKLSAYLGTEFIQVVGNGTIALQLAIKALGLKGKIITTPFSYVATLNSIIWENCTPIFVDVRMEDGNIDPTQIEKAVDKDVCAIMAVHVYGNPCDVRVIDEIAGKHNLKVIYDAAHAFAIEYEGESVLKYGDCSTLSFHATKVFHTIEGGAVVVNDPDLHEKIFLLKSFGHRGENHFLAGINGKCSEMHAIFGLAMMDELPEIFRSRKEVSETYDEQFDWNGFRTIEYNPRATRNYAYYPLIFDSEKSLLETVDRLVQNNILPRRYFHPVLNDMPYLSGTNSCDVARDLASRAICIPLYPGLEPSDIKKITDIINKK